MVQAAQTSVIFVVESNLYTNILDIKHCKKNWRMLQRLLNRHKSKRLTLDTLTSLYPIGFVVFWTDHEVIFPFERFDIYQVFAVVC